MSKKFNATEIRDFLTPQRKPAFMESCNVEAWTQTMGDITMVKVDELCCKMIGALRGIHTWYHTAHVLAKGTGFAGDHVHLYGEIYNEITDQLDGTMEKILGLLNEESLICPRKITSHSLELLEMYDGPSDKSGHEIAQIALQIEKDFLTAMEILYKVAKSHELMTLGLEDFIAGLANTHERYVYLLQQRVKSNRD